MMDSLLVLPLEDYEARFHDGEELTTRNMQIGDEGHPFTARERDGAVAVILNPFEAAEDLRGVLVFACAGDGRPLWNNPANEGLANAHYLAAAVAAIAADKEQNAAYPLS